MNNGNNIKHLIFDFCCCCFFFLRFGCGDAFCTDTFLQTDDVTYRSLYTAVFTRRYSYTDAFIHRGFYAISIYPLSPFMAPASSGGGQTQHILHRFTSRFLMESVQKVGMQCHALHSGAEPIHTYSHTTHQHHNSR